MTAANTITAILVFLLLGCGTKGHEIKMPAKQNPSDSEAKQAEQGTNENASNSIPKGTGVPDIDIDSKPGEEELNKDDMEPQTSYRWEAASNGDVPSNTVRDSGPARLGICRASYTNGVFPGSLVEGVGCYIVVQSGTVLMANYEVLTVPSVEYFEENFLFSYSIAGFPVLNAFSGGKDQNNFDLFICVAPDSNGNYLVGSLYLDFGYCYTGMDANPTYYSEYYVLTQL